MPRQVRVLRKRSRLSKGTVFLLEGAGPGNSPVVAKLCGWETAGIERAVYVDLLPRLPGPNLRCYGEVRERDGGHCWLFLEDAGDGRYSAVDPHHRRLAARWLATLQVHAAEIVEASDLPDRGPRHYLIHLLNAREDIVTQLRRQKDEQDGRLVLADLLAKLEALESRWGELAAICDAFPQTLVHGDLVSSNLRISRNGRGVGLAAFDWEMGGIGVQAPDLAQLLEPERSALARRQRTKQLDRFSANPCLRTYRSALIASGAEVDPETVELSAAVGNVFRCLAGIDWTCSKATATWFPVDSYRVYAVWLGNAMKLAGLSPPGPKGARAGMTARATVGS
jgi:hypothetical protein